MILEVKSFIVVFIFKNLNVEEITSKIYLTLIFYFIDRLRSKIEILIGVIKDSLHMLDSN